MPAVGMPEQLVDVAVAAAGGVGSFYASGQAVGVLIIEPLASVDPYLARRAWFVASLVALAAPAGQMLRS
jgi:hypothetical protein